jgi:hypothetical protein
LLEWLGSLLNNILFVIFLIILFGTFIYIGYKSTRKKLDILKEKWEQASECEKAKWQDKKRRYTDYFWANPWLFVVGSLGFFMLYALSLFLYDATGIWLFIFIFVCYLVFVKYTISWYINFPKIAAERFGEHKKAILDAICKDLDSHRDKINEFLAKYNLDSDTRGSNDDCTKNMIVHPIGVAKFDFPPFIALDAGKKNVIAKSTLQVIVLERDFMFVCLNTTEFDLLYPKRKDKKKKCDINRGMGDCKDIFYSTIKYIAYDGDEAAIKIYFWENVNEEPFLIKVAKKEDAKPTIDKIKEKIRLVERQRLNKIAEVLNFERLRNDSLKVEVVNEVNIQESTQEEPNQEEVSKEEKQESSQTKED